MKKVLIYALILLVTGLQSAFAEEPASYDMEINSLYAANKLDDTFNLILSIPQEKRTAQHWLLMGNIMMDYKKTGDAEELYKSSINADNKFYKAYYNLGNIYLSQNKIDLAAENFKLATKYNKEFAPAYYNLGCCYIKTGDFKKAKSALLDAIYYKSTDANYHYNLAYVYKQLGKNKEAQVYLDYYNKIENGNN